MTSPQMDPELLKEVTNHSPSKELGAQYARDKEWIAERRDQLLKKHSENWVAGPLLGTINKCLRRSLAPPIELEEGWVKAPAEEAAPQLELLLFCSSNRATGRYHKLWPVLEKMHEDYGPRGLRLTWVTHPASTRISQELVDFSALLEELNITWSAGMDISSDLSSYEAYDVNRASTHLYYIDGAGQFKWHLMDSMHWDEGLMRAVVERVLAKP